jgi:hypothetical protein
MNLKQLAKRLESTKIDNLEDIARSISVSTQEEFNEQYAFEIARQKLDELGLSYQEFSYDFPYMITQGEGILVGVAPTSIVPDTRKNKIKNYTNKIKPKVADYEGIIQFLPFQMNGKNVRATLESELDIAFVNMPYDGRSLERRFRQYCCR